MVVIGARDIACTAGTRPAAVECLVHSCQHDWMLSHSKIVVRTPNRHLFFSRPRNGAWREEISLLCVPDRQSPVTDLPSPVHGVACKMPRHSSLTPCN